MISTLVTSVDVPEKYSKDFVFDFLKVDNRVDKTICSYPKDLKFCCSVRNGLPSSVHVSHTSVTLFRKIQTNGTPDYRFVLAVARHKHSFTIVPGI